jgi:hypothetical protein
LIARKNSQFDPSSGRFLPSKYQWWDFNFLHTFEIFASSKMYTKSCQMKKKDFFWYSTPSKTYCVPAFKRWLFSAPRTASPPL